VPKFSTQPLYLQLHDALTERVASGQWKPGTAIPNEGDLAREFRVSVGTMRKALDLMETEQLVTRRQGRGTFVNDQTARDLAWRFCNIRTLNGSRVEGQFSVDKIEETQANERERERLDLQENERVYRIRRLRMDGDRLLMVEDVSLPTALFLDVPDMIPDIVALALQNGIVLGKAKERIRLEVAEPAVSKLLNVPDNSEVLVLDRVIHTLLGRPAEWRMGYCHLGREYIYRAEMK
jgi:GntR family transcriptional regulator